MALWGSRYPDSCRKIMSAWKISIGILLLSILTISGSCRSQAQRYLCSDGFGTFTSQFSTGVTVTVGPTRNGGFVSHSCDASLRWGSVVLSVATAAYRVDIDVMGADLGLGVPVVAFQIQNSYTDKLMVYRIYTLKKPPKLVSTITGGDSYDARDRFLEGRNEIWTDDATAVDGFESLPLSSFDFLPTVALRFEKHQLTDVSPEFQPYFDRQIAQVKAQLDARSLKEFKDTDGKLSTVPPQLLAELHEIVRTKIAILEIVWAYLYSGREQEAWNALAEMWPPADVSRIRTAIENARAHGILRQAQEDSKPAVALPWKRHAMIFNMEAERKEIIVNTAQQTINGESDGSMIPYMDDKGEGIPASGAIPPKVIFIGIPHRSDEQLVRPETEVYLNLIVDAAGKVQSAELADKAHRVPGADADIRASATWNFIPAFSAGQPVACRIRLVALLQR